LKWAKSEGTALPWKKTGKSSKKKGDQGKEALDTYRDIPPKGALECSLHGGQKEKEKRK